MNNKLVPMGLSNKHIHITREDCDILFGEGYELTNMKDIVQPGQYATEEKLDVVGPKGKLTVRIIGPVRPYTQLEVSISDTYKLGVPAVIRMSGDLEGTPGFKIIGPKGEVEKDFGCIVAARHVHLSPEEAEAFNMKDGDVVSAYLPGERSILLNNVIVRSGPTHKLEMHIDVEEGNAACAKNNQMVALYTEEDLNNISMADLIAGAEL